MNEFQSIAERIRKMRTSLGLSREAFAEKTGVSRATIYRIERGDDGVSVKNLLKVMQFLELSLETRYRPKVDINNLPKRPNIYQLMAME